MQVVDSIVVLTRWNNYYYIPLLANSVVISGAVLELWAAITPTCIINESCWHYAQA